MPAETRLFRCLNDNYGVLLHDPASGATASIDAPEAAPIEAALKAAGWKLTDILSLITMPTMYDGIQALRTNTNVAWWRGGGTERSRLSMTVRG
jgi:hydroxyacylglutathione hydrolase